MQNFSELDTTIYLANMSAMRFWAQGRGKNRENIDKKGKGRKNPMFSEGLGVKNRKDYGEYKKTPYLCKTIVTITSFIYFCIST